MIFLQVKIHMALFLHILNILKPSLAMTISLLWILRIKPIIWNGIFNNICVRDEQGSWCPVAHILTAREDSDITAEGLKVLKKWCGGCWHLRYMLTDDSAGEQCAVRKAFPGLEAGELEPTHFLCRVHSERA